MNRFLKSAVGITIGVAFALPAAASYTTYFAEDVNSSASVPLASTPNANAASAQFQSRLVGTGTEKFDSLTGSSPFTLTFPGAGTATLTGNASISSAVGNGRYPISSPNYLEVATGTAIADRFILNFGSPVAAFGFFGVDIGDFGAQLAIDVLSTSGVTTTFLPSHTLGTGSNRPGDGSVLFFGLIGENAADVFSQVTFRIATAGASQDFFAFDNMTIGSLSQVTPPSGVPEPSGLVLMALAMCAAGVGFGQRRQSK